MGVLANGDHERACQLAHKRIWAGEKRSEAQLAVYLDVIYDGEQPDSEATAANVRKFFNGAAIKARMAELAGYSAKLAGIDAGWAQLKLRDMVEANVDDYLSPADDEGNRYFDMGEVPREKLAQLVELHQEQTLEEISDSEKVRTVRKVRIKLPDKIQAIGLMAKIAGWLAPEKQEHSGGLTLEQLVTGSYKPKQGTAP